MQHKITVPSNLLDQCGQLIQRGYATEPILNYNREKVAKKLSLKEWDYYLIYNKNYALALLVGNSPFVGLISASLIDLKLKVQKSSSAITVYPISKIDMPQSSECGNIVYNSKWVKVSFVLHGNERILDFEKKDLLGKTKFRASIILSCEPKDSMVIATPFFEDKRDFYYNRKIIGMKARGKVWLEGEEYEFMDSDSFGLLDWGRGVWPHETTWYWGAGQGVVDGKVFGFNLGYGFGNIHAANENMLFLNGMASKLKDVFFEIPENCFGKYVYMKPWKIVSSDCRFEMVFEPIYNRKLFLSIIVLSTDQNQVFGKFTGRAVLDDGTVIELKDFLGFVERVKNRW